LLSIFVTYQANQICKFFVIIHQPYTTLMLELSMDILIFTSKWHEIMNVLNLQSAIFNNWTTRPSCFPLLFREPWSITEYLHLLQILRYINNTLAVHWSVDCLAAKIILIILTLILKSCLWCARCTIQRYSWQQQAILFRKWPMKETYLVLQGRIFSRGTISL
jgi:hypothetical protein